MIDFDEAADTVEDILDKAIVGIGRLLRFAVGVIVEVLRLLSERIGGGGNVEIERVVFVAGGVAAAIGRGGDEAVGVVRLGRAGDRW